jgi:hypothetical protein
MISDTNRLRLKWIARARVGAMFPEELFKVDKYGNGWGGAVTEAVQAALDEIERLQGELAMRAEADDHERIDINKWRP